MPRREATPPPLSQNGSFPLRFQRGNNPFFDTYVRTSPTEPTCHPGERAVQHQAIWIHSIEIFLYELSMPLASFSDSRTRTSSRLTDSPAIR
eukprot:scaffold75427_cov58-Attheya_sp.AAC.4